MNPESSSNPNPVAFCQNCGKPLSPKERRDVGQAVFCEPCLVQRVAAPPPGRAPGGVSPGPPPAQRYPSGMPNPGLAALLGFIPGVGAMYNGQYAKGLVHLAVFAILVSLSNQNGIFGIFIAGWVLYQVIEAYHTARARRDGTPLPNPFGLNDLGERLGFGKSWPAAPPIPPVAPTAPPPPTDQARSASDWERSTWEQANAPHQPQQPPPSSAPTPPYTTPYESPYTGPYPIPQPRFPTGALWLIGLGILFLVGNAGIFRGLPIRLLLPFLILGAGLWLFVHKMMSSGPGLGDDGSRQYRGRLYLALRGSVWIMLAGILFLLDNLDILSWGRSWPLWIILAGVMSFLHRLAVPQPAYPAPSPFHATQPAPPADAPPSPEPARPGASLSIIPRDEEGR